MYDRLPLATMEAFEATCRMRSRSVLWMTREHSTPPAVQRESALQVRGWPTDGDREELVQRLRVAIREFIIGLVQVAMAEVPIGAAQHPASAGRLPADVGRIQSQGIGIFYTNHGYFFP